MRRAPAGVAILLIVLTASGAPAAEFLVDSGDPQCDDASGQPAFCSLAPAVAAATPGSTVSVAAGVYAGPENRAIEIDKSLTITGAGRGQTVIDAQGTEFLFTLQPGPSGSAIQVAIRDLDLVNGAPGETSLSVTGAGLELVRVGMSHHPGGALRVAEGGSDPAQVRITESLFEFSHQAVVSESDLEIVDSEFRHNSAEFPDFASAVEGSGIIRGSLFVDNGGEFQGSAVFFAGTIADSRFVGNRAGLGGAVRGASSGEVFPGRGLTLDECEFRDNQAVRGGAVMLEYFGPLESGTDPPQFAVHNSTFENNRAGLGGGLYVEAASSVDFARVRLVNNTFSGNEAEQQGGGIYATGEADLSLDFVTLEDNRAGQGAGLFLANGANRIGHTALAGAEHEQCMFSFGFSGESLGYNLAEDESCSTLLAAPTDLNGRAAGLLPLADNGGPTRTHLPAPGSPLINSGAEVCTDAEGSIVDRDQRGSLRPFGGRCDRGAVESGIAGGEPELPPAPIPVPVGGRWGLPALAMLLLLAAWRWLGPRP